MYTLISFFKFDGQVHDVSRHPALFFGVDGIFRYHGGNPDLSVLFDHEAFHLYQYQVNPSLISSSPPLSAAVWSEGLATYVSQQLNPSASRLNVLLDDQELAAATPETVRKIAVELEAVFESRDPRQQARFLQYGYQGDLPARGGYLIGLMLAERLGQQTSLRELARLPMSSVSPLMRREMMSIMHANA